MLDRIGNIDYEATGRDRIHPVTGQFDFSIQEIDRTEARRGLDLAREALMSGKYDLVIMDEINSLVRKLKKYLPKTGLRAAQANVKVDKEKKPKKNTAPQKMANNQLPEFPALPARLPPATSALHTLEPYLAAIVATLTN